MLCYTTLYYTTLYYTILYYTILYYTILYAMLCYTILYAMLYYTIPYYAIIARGALSAGHPKGRVQRGAPVQPAEAVPGGAPVALNKWSLFGDYFFPLERRHFC